MSLALNTVLCMEQHRVVGLLEHAATFCDELVVVVDESSTDGTYQRARDFGATTVWAPHSLYCEPQRPIAAAYTKGDWILVLDGDEFLADFAIVALQGLDREKWKTASLPRASTVEGVPVTDSLDKQLRWFARGHVYYSMGAGSRIAAIDPTTMYDPVTPGWIIHEKTRDEQDMDVHREGRIRGLFGSPE